MKTKPIRIHITEPPEQERQELYPPERPPEIASLRAAIVELQAEVAKLRPGWTPKVPIQPK